jgi:hypothetical protein
MVTAAERELAGAGIAEAPAVVVADAGYWHHDQMDQLSGRGIQAPREEGVQGALCPRWPSIRRPPELVRPRLIKTGARP